MVQPEPRKGFRTVEAVKDGVGVEPKPPGGPLEGERGLEVGGQGLQEFVGEVTARFPLEEADKAYRLLDQGEILGRAVVVMG